MHPALPGPETVLDSSGPLGAPHAWSAAEVLAALGASAATGLTEIAAAEKLGRYGPNTVAKRKRRGAFAVFLHQFRSLVVALLAAAAALAFFFGEWKEASAIAGVLVLNAGIGFFTEIKALRSIEALGALGGRTARVCRDGRTRLVPAENLVPGDIVLLDAGDALPADLRLVEASGLEADESALTGESIGVGKSTAPVGADARAADRTSMLFRGASVTSGSGAGVVVATGMRTELGRISRLADEAGSEATPLERKLARLSGQLVWATLVLAVIIGAAGLARGEDTFLMIEAAIALAIAAIPEGLPIVATLALARGMWRMARQNALIERLAAVETLGAATAILTDKTGTLTENRMAVRKVWLPGGILAMGGAGFETADREAPINAAQERQLGHLLRAAVLCSNAALGRISAEDTGDPMELALLRAGRMAGSERSALLGKHPEVFEHAFNTSAKMMATVHRDGKHFYYAIKGAPEAVLASAARSDGAPLDAAARADWHRRIAEMGAGGLRVLAFAFKSSAVPDDPPFEALAFAGLIGLEDPPRPGVAEAIAACHGAGIRVVMITGDHPATARGIARAVGLGGPSPRVAMGRDLGRLADHADGGLLEADIFARVSPSEKLQLVRAFQAAGAIVAVTGDGVNDAPALKQADIGVAMGLRGTDVAREAADMVLLDDAFPTIVSAIREGRAIFGNIRRFAAYLLSCNLSEVMIVGIAVLSGLPLPLLPLQILFLNFVTDVFPAFALAMGEGERDSLKRPPRDPLEPILGRVQWLAIVLHGLSLTAATFGAFALADLWLGLDEAATVTVAFLTLAFAQLWHVFNMRARGSGAIVNATTRNPWVWGAIALCTGLLLLAAFTPAISSMLHMVALDARAWGIVLAISPLPVVAGPLVNLAAAAMGLDLDQNRGAGAAVGFDPTSTKERAP